MTVHEYGSRAWINDAADDADQRCLSGTIRAEQGENFTSSDGQMDIFLRALNPEA